jgi:hypothetical protein
MSQQIEFLNNIKWPQRLLEVNYRRYDIIKALRFLLKDSKNKASSTLTQERAIILNPNLLVEKILKTDEKRKEQLRLGKVIFEFFEKVPAAAREDKTKSINHGLSKDQLKLQSS